MNFYSDLWRPVSLSFSFLSVVEDYGSEERLFYGKMGWQWGGWYVNSLFCHFWLNMGPHFGLKQAKIWNSLYRILIFSAIERQKLYLLPRMWLRDWLTKMKTSKKITFCYFWPKIGKRFFIISFKYGVSS